MMMHPTLMATLAADRHAELFQFAESRRLVAQRSRRRVSSGTAGVFGLVGRASARLHKLTPSQLSAAEPCCA